MSTFGLRRGRERSRLMTHFTRHAHVLVWQTVAIMLRGTADVKHLRETLRGETIEARLLVACIWKWTVGAQKQMY